LRNEGQWESGEKWEEIVAAIPIENNVNGSDGGVGSEGVLLADIGKK
jgi:hypothetical protein